MNPNQATIPGNGQHSLPALHLARRTCASSGSDSRLTPGALRTGLALLAVAGVVSACDVPTDTKPAAPAAKPKPALETRAVTNFDVRDPKYKDYVRAFLLANSATGGLALVPITDGNNGMPRQTDAEVKVTFDPYCKKLVPTSRATGVSHIVDDAKRSIFTMIKCG